MGEDPYENPGTLVPTPTCTNHLRSLGPAKYGTLTTVEGLCPCSKKARRHEQFPKLLRTPTFEYGRIAFLGIAQTPTESLDVSLLLFRLGTSTPRSTRPASAKHEMASCKENATQNGKVRGEWADCQIYLAVRKIRNRHPMLQDIQN